MAGRMSETVGKMQKSGRKIVAAVRKMAQDVTKCRFWQAGRAPCRENDFVTVDK
jgi:hypothetical protein